MRNFTQTEIDQENFINMFSCDKLNRTKLEIICVTDCIGQKFNIVSDTASFIKQSNVSGYFINFSFFVRCINYRLTMRGNLIFPVPSNLWWKIMQWRIGRRKLLTKSWKNVSKVRRFTRNFGLGIVHKWRIFAECFWKF